MAEPIDTHERGPDMRPEPLAFDGPWELVTCTVFLDAKYQELGRRWGVTPAVAAIFEGAQNVATLATDSDDQRVRRAGQEILEIIRSAIAESRG